MFFPCLQSSNLEFIATQCRTLNSTLNQPNVPLGITYIAIGLVYLLLYVPCMIGILNPANFQLPCYKIMAVMGTIDIIQLTIGIISGYFSIVGASACNYTISMIICGLCVMGFWSLYCGVCIYLGINRCGDLCGGRFMVVVFKGYRTWVFMLIPLTFSICVFLFGPTMYYNSLLGSWFFEIDPYTHHEGNLLHLFINSISAAAISSGYALICIKLCIMTRAPGQFQNMSPAARNVLMQSFLITLPLLIASTMYILIQFATMPAAFTIILEITWQSCHGGMAVIYLVFNSSIRIKFLETICRCKRPLISAASHAATSIIVKRRIRTVKVNTVAP